MEEPYFVNIMLLGSTGSGKSASGNTIIGVRETFKEDFSPESVTRTWGSAETELDGQTITVIDTVGLSDTPVKIKNAETQIEKIITRYSVDVFLLVIKLGETFTVKKRNVLQLSQLFFASKLLNHTIVLFTHGDRLHEPIEKYLSKCETLRSVVGQCSGRYHVFNNKDEDPSQVTELLKKIESLRMMNAYKRYTEQDYKETQNDLLKKSAAEGGLGAAATDEHVREELPSVMGTVGKAALTGAATTAGSGLAATVGSVACTAGKAALIGATGGTALAAAAVAAAAAAAVGGVVFASRKYSSKEKDKSN